MASYASQVPREDRWKVILHIRSLQRKAAAQAAAEAAAQATPPGRQAAPPPQTTRADSGALRRRFGLWLAGAAPGRWPSAPCCRPTARAANLLLAGWALVGLGLAGRVLRGPGLRHRRHAGSSRFRRVPEAMTRVLPGRRRGARRSSSCCGRPCIPGRRSPSARRAASAACGCRRRSSWRARSSYLATWMLFAAALVRNSRRQDEDGDLAWTRTQHPAVGRVPGRVLADVLPGQRRLDHVARRRTGTARCSASTTSRACSQSGLARDD